MTWKGIFPALCTPMLASEEIDFAGLEKLIAAQLEAGMDGFVMLGTLGENGVMESAEKISVLKAAVKAVDGKVPVLTGVAETSTRLACKYISAATDAGVNGFMVLPAMQYKADSRETLTHFTTVAKHTKLPIMIYNNPVTYGVDILPEQFTHLAEYSNFVAIKESSDNVRRITDIKNACGNRFDLFCGVDDLALEACFLGATGWVAGLVNAFPKETRKLWDLALAGKYTEAVELYRWFTPLLHLDTHVKLVHYIKLAMQETGLGTEHVRAPKLKLTGKERQEVLGIIKKQMACRPKV